MSIFFRFFLLIAIPTTIVAKEIKDYSTIHFFNTIITGEKNTNVYHGPWAPLFKFDWLSGQMSFKDSPDSLSKMMLKDSLSEQLIDLEHYLDEELFAGWKCPISTLGNNQDYIRYLFRILLISYLYESIEKYKQKSINMEWNIKHCHADWNDVLKKCNPQSTDMKTFVKRAKVYVSENKRKYVKWSKDNKEFWKQKYQIAFKKNQINKDPVIARMVTYCDEKSRCAKNRKKVLGKICQKDIELFQVVCSENDSFWGISHVAMAYQLLSESHALDLIDNKGKARSCLKMFSEYAAFKEYRASWLITFMDSIYLSLQEEQARYMQGEMFLPGSLKEFDKKGLNDLLFAKTKPTPTPLLPKPKVVQTPIVQVEPTITPTPTVTVAIVETQTPSPTKEAPSLSAFEDARKKLKQSSSKKGVLVDMDKLRKEFQFTSQLAKRLQTVLKVYQTRHALEEMKTYDELGSVKQPVKLLFLKYLIDLDQHYGLYNIVDILGNEFYLVNDIEKISEPVLINLSNDADSNWQWQIKLLAEAESKVQK